MWWNSARRLVNDNLWIIYVCESVLHIWWTKKGSACSKKKKTNNMQHKQKENKC